MLFRKVFYNTAFLFVSRLILRGSNAIAVVFLARFLGVDRYGYFETAMAVVNILLVFNDLGMSTLLVRDASRDKSKLPVYFGNTLLVESVLSVCLYGVMILAAHFMYHNSVITSLVSLLGAANLIFEHRKVFRGSLRVVFKMGSLGWIEIVNGVTNLSMIFLITKLLDPQTGLFRLAQSQLIINLIVVALFGGYALLVVRMRPRLALNQIWPMIKQSWMFSITQLFTILYLSIDQIIISKLRPIQEVGWYSAPFKIIVFLVIVPQMVFQVIQPIMFRLAKEDITQYKRIHFTLLRYFTAFGLPIGAMCFIYAQPLVLFLFGKDFIYSALALQWFGAFIMVDFIESAAEYSLTSLDRQKAKIIIQIFTVAFNAILDVVLILKFGFFGASIANFIVECFLAICFIYVDLKTLKEPFSVLWSNIWKPILVTGVVGIFAYMVLNRFLSPAIAIPVCGVIYLGGLLSLKFLRPYDLKLLKQLLPKNKRQDADGAEEIA